MRRIGYNKKEAKILQQTIFDYLQQPLAAPHDLNALVRKFAECEPVEKQRIVFSDKAMNTIKELVRQCDKEIAWNCTVTKTGRTYKIEDVVMFPQIVTGTSVDVDETKYANWVATLPEATLNKLRFHGHSHVNMGVTPSGIDTKYQADMLPNITDYYIYMIFNKRSEMYACIWDVEHKTFYDVNDIEIVYKTPCKLEAQNLIKEYVTTPYKSMQTVAANNYWNRTQREPVMPRPVQHGIPGMYPRQFGMSDKEVADYVDTVLGGDMNDCN